MRFQTFMTFTLFFSYFRIIFFYALLGVLFVLFIPFWIGSTLLPSFFSQKLLKFNAFSIVHLAKWILGIHWRIEGQWPIKKPFIVASNHQSAWETFWLFWILDAPVFLLKNSLLQLPFIGWCLKRAGMIGIERSAKKAKNTLTYFQKAQKSLQDGRCLIIFPEGTRVATDQRGHFHKGIGMLHHTLQKARLSIPIVPVAINAGLFWKKSFFKHPGCVTIRILPPFSLEYPDFHGESPSISIWIKGLEDVIHSAKTNLPKA